jgi:hypothetical protein
MAVSASPSSTKRRVNKCDGDAFLPALNGLWSFACGRVIGANAVEGVTAQVMRNGQR